MSIDPAQDARYVAELDAESSVSGLAVVYAEALFGAAEERGLAASIVEEYQSLLRDVLAPNPKFEEVLTSALISHEDKVEIINRVFGSRSSELMLNFLKVASRNDRLDILRSVYTKLLEVYNKARGKVDITVTTATPIDSKTASRIAAGVTALIEGEPIVRTKVDPDLIGGIVVRVGDTVYDASIATQLKNVRQQIIDRSAHEIQSRRDRFSNPEGN